MVRVLAGVIVAVCLGLLGLYLLFVAWPRHDPHPVRRPASDVILIRGAKVYPSPDEAPIEAATILVRNGRIAALGTQVSVPTNAVLLACDGCVVTAGFWNAHVHFTEPKWDHAWWTSAAQLNTQLADMITSRGFTTVVDVGSDLRITLSLRRRIEHGEILGPTVYTAGSALYPPHGIPVYVRESTPWFIQRLLLQPEDPQSAARLVRQNIDQGADVLKLFTGSYVERGKVLPMPEPIARAAVEVAHAHRQLVFSHPSDLAGTLVAIHSGVDVLAHAPDDTDGIDDTVLQAIVDRHMAMVPTLKMFGTTVTTKASYLDPIYDEVRRFHALGGELMFGTDVGYMKDYSTRDEFFALAKAGLTPMDVLRMLTTTPARRFGVLAERGTVAVGKVADLVLLQADPAQDLGAFARVGATVSNGRVVYGGR